MASRSGAILPQKRPGPDSGIHKPSPADLERRVHEAIKSRRDMGVSKTDLRNETGIPETMVTKAVKSLLNKNLIKEVVAVNHRKVLMDVEFQPSKAVTGGSFYSEGSIDTEFVQVLKDHCRVFVLRSGVTTLDAVTDSIRKSPVFRMELTSQQIADVLGAMVLDKDIEECRSTGVGDFSFVPRGRTCYRLAKGNKVADGAFSSIPCGVCPRIRDCSPDGIISPNTCVYYNNWLDAIDF